MVELQYLRHKEIPQDVKRVIVIMPPRESPTIPYHCEYTVREEESIKFWPHPRSESKEETPVSIRDYADTPTLIESLRAKAEKTSKRTAVVVEESLLQTGKLDGLLRELQQNPNITLLSVKQPDDMIAQIPLK
jgi:hypothetical protein